MQARLRIAAGFVVVAALAIALSVRASADADDGPRDAGLGRGSPATQRPQFRSPQTNAARAIGLDEVEGPTIFEGIKALNPIDALRDDLRDTHGIYLRGLYIGDPYANLGGGLKRGATFSGRLDVEIDIDGRRALGLDGTTAHANAFQIHGRSLSEHDVGNLLEINDIAARPETRLYEAWIEQRFGDKLAVRAGQQGIDVEFLTSNYGANFINASFGWPALPTADLPDGGPAYPLATPAIRFKIDPARNLTILAAVFDGDPAGPCPGDDPQRCDTSGTNFRIGDPPLVIAEAQYRYNQGKDARLLPGTLKLGAFGHFGRFDDQRYAASGMPLALAPAGAMPLAHSPNGGVYGILDQQIYRVPGDDDEKGIGVFTRVIGAPSDRNLIDLYVDGGLSALGLVPGRPNDFFGVAAAFAKISSAAIGADLDANAASAIAAPVRDYEAVVELTYQAEIVPGLAIQPTFQYISHPGGHVVNPLGSGLAAIPDAKVFGATTLVRF